MRNFWKKKYSTNSKKVEYKYRKEVAEECAKSLGVDYNGDSTVDDDPEIAEGMPQDENAAAAQMM